MFCVLRLTITGFVLPLSLVPLPFAQVCSFYQCVSPQKQCRSIFLGICSLMRLSAFTVIFSVSFTLSKLLRFRGVLVPISALQFRMLCLFCFSFMLYSVFFPHFFPRSGFSRALLPFVYNHLLPLKQWLCVGFFSPLQV